MGALGFSHPLLAGTVGKDIMAANRVRNLCVLCALAALLFAAPAGAAIHQVTPGETLTSIAAADGLSVAGLAAANGLSTEAYVISGQILVIPAQTAGTESAATP